VQKLITRPSPAAAASLIVGSRNFFLIFFRQRSFRANEKGATQAAFIN